ncbi:F0F1 ATP synthase subunit gamma [Parvibaculum sp.]|jgi:F-type H+-transporting ATPase subunit gamma|uniref:F0F1 ATP synthase subunit gamma n=1 Tax=Parvibaculum sp. TaxID=2024848 RepID=UPI000C5173D3|nr:F0F1 ATP synthase subunit gamma [Parvibaculum sp.]HAC56843.1 F0F1 ATP synthase subunit gamma [Rhodobiaceae bacterium]MAU61008.1 F0F1 ATP synthase subunit gamma [Parvibaculum sp.]MBO6668596.1 F0F1 ATP synthase subunit gamma [Parvibaculum sp.]MBO6691084.1 F0F1 ATP synthase subunit gamma [Parvibaculum sp.]MBO6714272.1 F0F1 ATP synthase subunit gamma [Parvibaculum sp.]|tara:strand:- start:3829 stop:4716 length:888 start_codon:yes stop_codon:yes gene_type:complete
MASLKDLRNRIASVRSTQKITKAMQMVAAAKLRRAQEAAEAARPYAERMDRVLANLSAGMIGQPEAPALLVGNGRDDVHLLVVATADRGLCGGFNASIARLAREEIARLTAQGKTVKILAVGRKGRDALRRMHGEKIVKTFEFSGVRSIGFVNAEEIAATVLDMFEAGEFDVCTLFYSRFQSVVSQIPTKQSLIPAAVGNPDDQPEADLGGAIYEYEPNEEEILRDLLPRNLAVQVFRALLENAASEQGARMSAMDNATRNAGEMIDKLTITYNRTRQAQITKELIEIISGAEAL